ncbi:DUF2273 domain-containing protein [Paenibacillus chartarius]|uniref:DUF2273 domain-containing protein n=1 Tax=Paenibacillus chartarius TaxID=747481 RepID=A0ABV6DNJ5_9BACL
MWSELWERHRGKTIGAGAGIVLGFIYLFFGFWDMLIFAFISFVGYYIGKKVDNREELFPLQELWRQLSDKWRLFR